MCVYIFVYSIYLQTSSDDLVIDVCDDHGMDHSDPKQPGQNSLQDVKPDIRAVTRQMQRHVTPDLNAGALNMKPNMHVITRHDQGVHGRRRWVHSYTCYTYRVGVTNTYTRARSVYTVIIEQVCSVTRWLLLLWPQ